jgi:hypothetical protein
MKIKSAGHVPCRVDRGNTYTILAGTPEKGRPLSRLRLGLEDTIKMDLE